MTVVDEIERALEMTSAVVRGLTPARLEARSLCPAWDARGELNHLVGGMRIFAAQITGDEPDREHEDDWLGRDPLGAFAEAAAEDRAAWRRPGALGTTFRLSFGALPGAMAARVHLTEVLVHGSDLAVVSGQEGLIDEELCEGLLATMRGMDFGMFRRPGMFGEERAAAADAPAHRRLLAFLGRELP
jgi:uncharacterized protein (TIGR03086 family)